MKKLKYLPVLLVTFLLSTLLVSCETDNDDYDANKALELFINNYQNTWENSDGTFRINMSMGTADVYDGEYTFQLISGISFPTSNDIYVVYQDFSGREVVYVITVDRMTLPDVMEVTITRTFYVENGYPEIASKVERSFVLHKVES